MSENESEKSSPAKSGEEQLVAIPRENNTDPQNEKETEPEKEEDKQTNKEEERLREKERRAKRRAYNKARLKDPTKAMADIDERTKTVFDRKGYEVKTIIGFGAFGEVYKALQKSTGILCAVKVIDLTICSQRYKQKFLPRELAALMEIRHPGIIHTFDIFRSNKKIYVFMEFAGNGDLSKFLRKKGILKEEKARYWFKQVSDAMQYLHEEMFTAHRDIKIDNVLLSDEWNTKLTDFGFATEAVDPQGNVVLSETFCGTLPYYCPQILVKRPYNPFKADIWAMGVVLYAMTHNRFPFHYKDHHVMQKEQKSHSYIASRIRGSKELKDLLMRMFEADEDRRLSIMDVVQHRWTIARAVPVVSSPPPNTK